MKFKKFLSVAIAVSLMCSSVAFAAAMRVKYRVNNLSGAGTSDLYFENFANIAPGEFPAGVKVGTSTAGSATTEIHNVGNGEKNCLKITDTDHTDGDAGAPSVTLPFASVSGLVAVEYRMKYIKDGSSNYNSLIVQLNGDSGMASRVTVVKNNGRITFNQGGLGVKNFEETKIWQNSWYTIKYILDFNQQKIDVVCINEGSGAVIQLLDQPFYTEGIYENLNSISVRTSKLGGSWVFDYFKVSKATKRMEEVELKKGVPANMILAPASKAVAGRVNIKLNDRYKYTTTLPYISENDNVMVTVRNIATMFLMPCFETTDSFIIKNSSNEFIFAKDGTSATHNGKPLALSENGALKDGKLFIPVADVANALNYESKLDKENSTLFITAK